MFGSRLKRGCSRTAMALVGLVLAFAAVSPASVLAKAGGTDRPVTGAGTGTISLDPVTGAFTGDVPGVSSQLGKVAVHIDGVGVPNADGTITGPGTMRMVAANGDELTGTIALTQTALPGGHTMTTVVVTITGGSGRFAGASGTLTVVCDSGPPDHVGEVLLITVHCKWTGQLSY